jgi:hypothetical protein
MVGFSTTSVLLLLLEAEAEGATGAFNLIFREG